MIAVVIPSKTDTNLIPCMEAVRKNEPDIKIIVVDDGLQFGSEWPIDIDVVRNGEKPFIFARNVNIGITEALSDKNCEGVVILGDDGLLRTPGGFSILARAAEEHQEIGIVSAVTNSVGNLNQTPKGFGLRTDDRMVCFVAVYIPRRTIETVGLLDERYVGYGLDDDDYCLRITKAGMKIGIHDGCFVDHLSLKSTYRGDPRTPADFHPNLRRFIEKWGHDNFGRPVA